MWFLKHYHSIFVLKDAHYIQIIIFGLFKQTWRRYVRGWNQKLTIAKISKIELDIVSYWKTSINRSVSLGSIKTYYFLFKSAIKNYRLNQNEPCPYIKMIFRKSKRAFFSFTPKRTHVKIICSNQYNVPRRTVSKTYFLMLFQNVY